MSLAMTQAAAAMAPLMTFLNESSYAKARRTSGILDFTFGNPQEMPLTGLVDALQRWAVPENPQWFAYKQSEPKAQETIAASLRSWRGLPFEPEDVVMTSGAFGAIAVILRALLDQGDEVIVNLPPWFVYEAMIHSTGARPVTVPVRAEDFDLDLVAIEAAITPATRLIIVNTPHNPTGKIYPAETLERLARLLTDASARHGRTIYLLSDEPYSRLVFEGHDFVSPLAFYPESLMAYSYGKVLLAPGQRVGYLAFAPGISERTHLRDAVTMAQLTCGWAYPNALLQHAIGDLERLSLDLAALQAKRDLMVEALRRHGYRVHRPEATFYLLPRSPIPDDLAFTERLAEGGVYVMPGTVCGAPGYFRICLTASLDMLQRSLPAFQAAIEQQR
ncbi:MAG: aminotransferase class I/II-fold pyridoxal phosphate-dependent enzyme [Pseudomonadota bacterium]